MGFATMKAQTALNSDNFFLLISLLRISIPGFCELDLTIKIRSTKIKYLLKRILQVVSVY